MRKYILKIEMAMVSHNGNIRHSAQSAFRPAVVGIRPLLGSFHWSAFRRSAFRHTPVLGWVCGQVNHLGMQAIQPSIPPV